MCQLVPATAGLLQGHASAVEDHTHKLCVVCVMYRQVCYILKYHYQRDAPAPQSELPHQCPPKPPPLSHRPSMLCPVSKTAQATTQVLMLLTYLPCSKHQTCDGINKYLQQLCVFVCLSISTLIGNLRQDLHCSWCCAGVYVTPTSNTELLALFLYSWEMIFQENCTVYIQVKFSTVI